MLPSYTNDTTILQHCSLLCRSFAVDCLPARPPSVCFLRISPAAFAASASSWLPVLIPFILCYNLVSFGRPSPCFLPCVPHTWGLSMQVEDCRVCSTLTVYGELLSLCYRRSAPVPLPSTKIYHFPRCSPAPPRLPLAGCQSPVTGQPILLASTPLTRTPQASSGANSVVDGFIDPLPLPGLPLLTSHFPPYPPVPPRFPLLPVVILPLRCNVFLASAPPPSQWCYSIVLGSVGPSPIRFVAVASPEISPLSGPVSPSPNFPAEALTTTLFPVAGSSSPGCLVAVPIITRRSRAVLVSIR